MIGKGVESRGIPSAESKLAELDNVRARRFHGRPPFIGDRFAACIGARPYLY
jgi:hypothetical protein